MAPNSPVLTDKPEVCSSVLTKASYMGMAKSGLEALR